MTNLSGTTLGKYHLMALLGRGGMAEVYKAFQPGLNRYVAIKILLSHLAVQDDFVNRFEREASVVARLRHPNIVQVYDFDHQDDLHYMVLEFIGGPTLSDELNLRNPAGKRFNLSETARIFEALASAVDYAHAQGMVHRDLKPSNTMITQHGQVVLTDFGIARIMGATSHTITGTITGTPSYMSPEQAKGERGDEYSDIYSLSVMLYEMLVGRVPFESDTPFGVIMQHISTPLPLPTRINPELPKTIERILVKGLSKEPKERYQTATLMSQALWAAIEGDITRQSLITMPIAPLASAPEAEDEPTSLQDEATIKERSEAKPSPLATPTTTEASWPIPLWAIALGVGVILILLASTLFLDTSPSNPSLETITPSDTATSEIDLASQATLTWLTADDDRDGLTNEEEVTLNTLPNKRDTDEDDLDDGEEVHIHKTDPLDSDSDNDGIRDGEEVSQGMDPLKQDTDGDGLNDPVDPAPLQVPTLTITKAPASTPTSELSTPIPQASDTPTLQPSHTPTLQPSHTPTSLRATPLPPTQLATIIPTETPTPTLTPLPRLYGKLAFSLEQNTTFGVYVLQVDATSPAESAVSIGNARQPALNSQGSLLLVDGRGGGIDAIFQVPSKGGQAKTVTCRSSTAESGFPTWSPDGTRLAFDGLGVDGANPQIYIHKLDEEDCNLGDNRLTINNNIVTDPNGLRPIWADDGRIYFRACSTWNPSNSGLCGIWSVQEGGTNPIQITDSPNHLPTDVKAGRLLYMDSSSGQWEVYAVNTSGTNAPINLTKSNFDDAWGTLSPDGRFLAFISNRNNGWAIWIANADGSDPKAWLPINPTWGSVGNVTLNRMSWSK